MKELARGGRAASLVLIASIITAQCYWKLPFEQHVSPADILALIFGLLLALLTFLASFGARSGPRSRAWVFVGMSGVFALLAVAEFILASGAIDIPIALLWLGPGLVLSLSPVATKEFGPARLNFLIGVSLQILELGRSVLATVLYGGGPEPASFEWIESASDLLVRAFYVLGLVETLRAQGTFAGLPAKFAGKRSSPALECGKRSNRIAIFMYRLSGGGAQRRSLTLANELASRGYEIDLVVLCGETKYQDQLSSAARFVRLDLVRWGVWHSRLHRYVPYRWIRVCLGFAGLARYLREEKPGVLVAAADRVLVTAVIAWRLAGCPTSLILRATNHPTANFKLWAPARKAMELGIGILMRALYSSASAIVAVSDGVGDEIHRLSGIPRERIITIFEPVVDASLAQKCDAPLSHPWFLPGEPPVILAVGRFRPQKDFPTLIKAFALVRRIRTARLVIIGEGRQRARLLSMIEEQCMGEDVMLAGQTENPFAWMARASLFVLSSVWEGLPGVLIEALACGCPVVSTNCPSGPWEILDAGAYGRLVPCRDPEAMAEAIVSSLDLPSDRQRLRDRAEAFSVSSSVERYTSLLEDCLGDQATSTDLPVGADRAQSSRAASALTLGPREYGQP